MAGVLQFTLGLEASKFLSQMGASSASVLSLAGSFKGLETVVNRVWDQVAKGAALNDLSKRTGENVGTLHQLEKAFEAVGVSADGVGRALLNVNRATGKGSGGLLEILDKMSKMGQGEATVFGRKLFGLGAGEMLQAAGDIAKFRDAFSAAGPTASTMDRMAGAFGNLVTTMQKVKRLFDPLFLGVAKYIAEPLQKAADALGRINLTRIGESLGSGLGLLFESFSDGTFKEVISLSISAAFEQSIGYAGKFAAAFGAALAVVIPSAMKAGFEMSKLGISGATSLATDVNYLAMAKVLEVEIDRKLKLKPAGLWTAADERRLQSAQTLVWETEGISNLQGEQGRAQRAEILGRLGQELPRTIMEALEAASQGWGQGGGVGGPASEALKNLMDGFMARWEALFPAGGAGGGGAGSGFPGGAGGRRSGATEWERIGFVFNNGGAGRATETTARNTTRMVSQLGTLIGAVRGQTASAVVNQ